MDERLQRLQNSAVEGDVDALYSILAEDPLVLERVDEIPFVTTPLHTAVSEGNIHFAKEMVNLKPSFASKRDQLGRSPLLLALDSGHQELVTWFLTIDRELVRVKGMGMVTPLHYAAKIDDETNLANFLYVCPSSIKDLTVKCETAVHVALKSGSYRALEVLLGWLQHFDKEEILRWEDEEGNNALCTAISENQLEMVKVLIKYVDVNRKNSKGSTALDIFHNRRDSVDAEIGRILRLAKAKRGSQDPEPQLNHREGFERDIIETFFSCKDSLVDYLCGKLETTEVFLKHVRLGDRIINRVPLEVQNVILVVAILTATATYQASLSPPGGFWQDEGEAPTKNNSSLSSNTTTNSSKNILGSEHHAGHMIQGSLYQLCFLLFNTVAFATSVCAILTITVGLRFSKIVTLSTSLFVLAYSGVMIEATPFRVGSVLWYLFYTLLSGIGFLAFFIPVALILRERLLKLYGRGQVRMGSLEQPKM